MNTFAGGCGPCWPLGCWPSADQLLLLRACLLEDRAAATAAFHAWRQRVPLAFVDRGSRLLLPLLQARLRSWAIDHPDRDRFRALARHGWARYRLITRELPGVLRLFREAGVPALLLKGAALNATVYAEGTRLMSDLDVAVPRSRAIAATRLLESNGWRPESAVHARLTEVTTGCHCQKGEHGHLDLHWDFFQGRRLGEREQRDLWRAGVTVDVGGEPARVLCPADQLLHTCEHGARYNDATPPFRWLADACHILRRGAPAIDWERLRRLARRWQLLTPVRATLRYLERHLREPIPRAAWDRLGRGEAAPGDRAEFYLTTRQLPAAHPFWQSLPVNLIWYARLSRARRSLGMGGYLAAANDLQAPLWRHLRPLLRVEAAAVRRRLGGAARRALAGWRREPTSFLSMTDAPSHLLDGFYAPEASRHGTFRWAQPFASVCLSLRRAAYRVTLLLAPVRAWLGDLDSSLTVGLNESPLPREGLCFENWGVSFSVPPALITGHDRQRLELRCDAWAMATADPRPLGIPLIGIRFTEVPGNASEPEA